MSPTSHGFHRLSVFERDRAHRHQGHDEPSGDLGGKYRRPSSQEAPDAQR